MLKKTDGRKRRKKSKRSLGKRSANSAAAQRLKELWADPEWRAEHVKINQRIAKERKGRFRLGVPDGMRKPEADRRWARAEKSAKKTMAKLKKTAAFASIDAKAEAALEAAMKVMRSPSNQTVRLSAARLVLDFTKTKPASKTELTVNKAEEWLKQVASESDADQEKENN